MLWKRVPVRLSLILVLALAACQSSGDDEGDFSVELAVTPDPPQVGPATIIITLRDANDKPITGATIDLEGTMTHAGMVPVFSQATEADVCPKERGHLTTGCYEAELEFTMGGDWVIIVRAELPDGSTLKREFDVPGVKKP